jgi:dihydrolipoamide dehydrogenase
MEIRGVTVHTGATIKEVTNAGGEKRVTILVGDQVHQVNAQKIIDSTVEVPNTENLGLENIGVAAGDSGILVDDHMRTNVKNMFAVGDVAGKFMLSHVAAMEGLVAAENAMGGTAVARYEAIPRCVYTIPEVAFVGLTERQALERGRKAKTLRLPLSANAAARVRWEGEGLVKMVVDEASGGILGVQMMGPRATDLIAECALAMVFEASPEILSQVIHAHPTLAEALKDVASLVQQA